MADITIVRQDQRDFSEADKETARRVIFGMVDGLGERGRRQWRGLWRRILDLEPGEMMDIKTNQMRLGWYHRRHFALEQAVFESQEKFGDFEQFRNWLKIGAGFVDWVAGPKGAIVPLPRSLSYAKLDQADMEQFHRDAVDFLRTATAGKVLWKHLRMDAQIEMIETILANFKE